MEMGNQSEKIATIFVLFARHMLRQEIRKTVHVLKD